MRKLKTEVRKMGRAMATATEQLTALTAKVDDLVADVRAALAVINGDTLSTEAQAALDALVTKVDALDTEVGDLDGSDTPPEEPLVDEAPVEEPTEPAPGEAPVTPPAERFID